MDFHNKEKSESTQRLERIDAINQQLNNCNPNIAYYDHLTGKFVYEIKFSLIKTILEEVRLGHKNFSEIKKDQRLEKITKQREELQKEVLEQPIGDYDVIFLESFGCFCVCVLFF